MSDLMMCATCKRVLDESVSGDEDGVTHKYIHIQQVVSGTVDHEPVPVPYDGSLVEAHCDFCHEVVPTDIIWTMPATDFLMPFIGTTSGGSWAACPECASLLERYAWGELVDRATRFYMARHSGSMQESDIRGWLNAVYAKLAQHATGPVYRGQPKEVQ